VRKSPIHLPVREGFDRQVIIFVTTCTHTRKPILCEKDIHQEILRAWRKADTWLVGRYVVMPDHIHLFCTPASNNFPELRKWIQYWKALASCAWPRMDEQPVWQKSFWDTELRGGESYERKWEYMRQNPVRKGLVATAEDWPFQGEMNKLDWFG
jgi:REP element-mobilizing transposase RayT